MACQIDILRIPCEPQECLKTMMCWCGHRGANVLTRKVGCDGMKLDVLVSWRYCRDIIHAEWKFMPKAYQSITLVLKWIAFTSTRSPYYLVRTRLRLQNVIPSTLTTRWVFKHKRSH
jgi:hypothetical protein